jgi:hypothetical protein
MGGVIVAEHAARVMRAPREDWASEESVEEARVEGVEDLVEVVVVALMGKNALPSSRLTHVFGLARDGFRRDMTAIAVGMCGCDLLLIELRNEDVSDCVVHGFRRMLKDVGEADMKAAVPQTDGCVQRCEATKTDIEGWNGRARP